MSNDATLIVDNPRPSCCSDERYPIWAECFACHGRGWTRLRRITNRKVRCQRCGGRGAHWHHYHVVDYVG